MGFLFLKETNINYTQRRDVGRKILSTMVTILSTVPSRKAGPNYEIIDNDEGQDEWQPAPSLSRPGAEDDQVELEVLEQSTEDVDPQGAPAPSPELRTTYTYQVVLQILSVSLLAFHKVASDTLIPIFLANTSAESKIQSLEKRSFLKFSGGFGMNTATIGVVLLTQAVVAIVAQLFAVPYIIKKFGALRTYRWTLFVFPWMYFLTPFVVKLPFPISIIALLLDLWIKVLLVALGYVCSAIL